MAEVWEGIDLPWNPPFGNWVLKRMELCAEDNGVRVRFVTDRGLVKELTMPEMLQAIGSDARVIKHQVSGDDWRKLLSVEGTRVIRHQISWDDWRRVVSRIDYQKYGR